MVTPFTAAARATSLIPTSLGQHRRVMMGACKPTVFISPLHLPIQSLSQLVGEVLLVGGDSVSPWVLEELTCLH